YQGYLRLIGILHFNVWQGTTPLQWQEYRSAHPQVGLSLAQCSPLLINLAFNVLMIQELSRNRRPTNHAIAQQNKRITLENNRNQCNVKDDKINGCQERK